MTRSDSHQVTQLLIQWSDGNEIALSELMPLVYDELRRIAKSHISVKNRSHTFETTELIHEAYLKVVGQDKQNWQNRAHFFGVAAQAMRHIMVDYARSKQTKKRGGLARDVTLEENAVFSTERSDEIVALDEALKTLAKLDERKCRVVELKFFGGLTVKEISEVMKVSTKTIKRDWRFARLWLLRELSNQCKSFK